MDGVGLNSIYSKHLTFLDCYALVWNPVSEFEPLFLFPALSDEFAFIPNEIYKR